MVCLIYFSDALGMIHIEPEPPTTANDSCHMSDGIVWLSGGGDEGEHHPSDMFTPIPSLMVKCASHHLLQCCYIVNLTYRVALVVHRTMFYYVLQLDRSPIYTTFM